MKDLQKFKNMKTYKIKLTDKAGNERILEIMSTDIEWSIKQYQRNREPFTWDIVEEEEYKNDAIEI